MVYTRKTWADGSGGGTPITAAELNRMESGFGLDRRWVPPSTATSIDEFNTGSLSASWTRVDGVSGGSARATWTEGADVLSAYNAGGDATGEYHSLMIPLSGFGGSVAVGDAFTTHLTVVSGQWAATWNNCAGITLADGVTAGSGGQATALAYCASPGQTYNSGTFLSSGYATNNAVNQSAMRAWDSLHLRLVCSAANTWRTDVSPDGITWLNLPNPGAKTFTPTHVGFTTSSWNTSQPFVASFEYLRRYSGVS